MSFITASDFVGFIAFLCAVIATVLGVVLKVCGVLLLSWWWVLAPLPVLVVVFIFLAGLLSLFR